MGNVATTLNSLNSNIIGLIVIAFILGMIISYLIMLGKQKKESIDKKKLESYVKGINYIIEDETDKAIKELTDTAKLDPDMVDIYISIGNLFRKKGEINRALIIHKSLLARPNLSKEKKLEVYLNIGIDYRKAGLYDRAKEYFKNALSLSPKNTMARKLIYEVYEDSKDWENALIWHKRFDGSDKHVLAHIYTEIGKQKMLENKPEEAKKNFERAIKEYKDCIDAMLNLGDIYLNFGKIEKAYSLWENVCKKRPELCNLALQRIKDVNVLKKTIVKLLEELPEDNFILFFAAQTYFELGEYEKMLSLYKLLLKRGIKSTIMLKHYIETQLKNDRFLNLFAQTLDTAALAYTCVNCGYSTSKPFFKCPKCKSWDKVKVDIR